MIFATSPTTLEAFFRYYSVFSTGTRACAAPYHGDADWIVESSYVDLDYVNF